MTKKKQAISTILQNRRKRIHKSCNASATVAKTDSDDKDQDPHCAPCAVKVSKDDAHITLNVNVNIN